MTGYDVGHEYTTRYRKNIHNLYDTRHNIAGKLDTRHNIAIKLVTKAAATRARV